MQTQDIMALVKPDFDAVNQLIAEQLQSQVPLVETIGKYIVNSGGKRMRPLLVVLVSHALKKHPSQDSIRLATVIEFLHTATLLHDDVVDTSTLRRGNATANAKWGNAPSVLVGDFLYSRAFQLMVELGNLPVLDVLAHATNVIAEGEVLQLSNCKNPDLSETEYLKVITAKTAMLFEAATHSAALLNCTDARTQQSLADYGRLLGIAFQLKDDALDYSGNPEEMGKNVGDDLAEGKTTLPLIQAQRVLDETSRQFIRDTIRQGRTENMNDLLALVNQSQSLEYTESLAEEFAQQAKDCLKPLNSESPYTQALIALADIAVNRRQ